MSEPTKAVFLSYAREDTDAARRIAEALRGFGIEVWFDQAELRGGEAWDAKIKKQIRECALFVPLVSGQTQERNEGYFRREWLLAVERTRDMAVHRAFVVPVVIDGTPEAGASVPEEFMRYQWTRLAGGEPTPEFVAQVKRLLEAPKKPALKPDLPRPPTLPPEFKQAARAKAAAAAAAAKSKPTVPGWMWVLLAVVLVLAGGGAFLLREPELVSPPTKVTPVARPAAPVATDKSIAVPPSTNMSEDKESGFSAAGPAHAAAPSFDQWADDFAARWVALNPQSATRAQYFSGAEQDALDRQLILGGAFGQTYGVKAARERAEFARRGLEELSRYPAATLTTQQRTSAAVIRWSLEDAVRSAAFAQQRFVFEQFGGLHLGLVNFLTATHPIRHGRDIENYLARLALVAPRIDEGIAEAKSAAAAGMIPPRFILQRVIEQLDGFTAVPPADNVFVATLDKRIGALGAAVPAEQRARFVAAAGKEVAATVIPAYRRVRAMLAEQLPVATDEAGAWRLPQGADYYAASLESLTTTKLTPAEIHAIGLREVTRIEAEMESILQQLGYKDGSIQARIEKLNATLNPPAEPDPRPALLAKVEALVHDAERRSVAVFDLRPKSPVTVKREPAFSEKSAAAHYTNPAPDGSSPGIYWLPLADLGPRVTWLGTGLKSTAYHEAVPGHHFQLSIQQESAELPRYRKLGVFGFNSAYIEGWALYAERLAAENGWYEGDLPGRLGYLQLQLFRARRLVADTGLHAMKWTRQQVIDYGFTPQETERYIVWPGQACSYMIGQLRIMELREKARAALGQRFSIKEFHNLVLRGGSMPLDVLAQEVDNWIVAGGAGKPVN